MVTQDMAPSPAIITYAAAPRLRWPDAVQAIREGHLFAPAQIRDSFLGPATGTMMSRSAYIPGLGYGAKSFTVFDGNGARGLPTVQGAMLVFDPDHGGLTAVIDSPLVTEFKTAADSVLGASLLARPDSRHLLIVGAGSVAASLIRAYRAVLPGIARISVWARRPEQAQALVAAFPGDPALVAVTDLRAAVEAADIISSATMAREPVILGDWVRPGTHVDLIGAFKADMREADDALMAKSALFVDSRATTLGHIGELMLPIASGAITEADVLGDLYDLVRPGARRRRTPEEVTVYKNGGGAHLDLMIATYIARALRAP